MVLLESQDTPQDLYVFCLKVLTLISCRPGFFLYVLGRRNMNDISENNLKTFVVKAS